MSALGWLRRRPPSPNPVMAGQEASRPADDPFDRINDLVKQREQRAETIEREQKAIRAELRDLPAGANFAWDRIAGRNQRPQPVPVRAARESPRTPGSAQEGH